MITLQQIKSFLNPFKGATSLTNGQKGLVPTPKIGDENKFLQGNGTWKLIEQGWKGLPVGFRCNWDGTIPPETFLFEDGQILNRNDFPLLWKFANDNNMVVTKAIWDSNRVYGLFNSGDGTTTFQMPFRNNGFFERFTGANAGTLGYQQNEGLPNILGSVGQGHTATTINGGWHNYNNAGMASSNSAIYLSGITNGNSCTWNNYGDAGLITFNASRSNSIYGASSHVTPINIATKSIRKYK